MEITMQCVQAYADAGFSNIEVTMNTPDVANIISECVQKYKGLLNVGAGTVCNNDELNKAIDAGAQFIVSPLTDVAMIESCVAMEKPIFPGVFTPTEIYQAWSAGARMVKLFPAGLLGPSYIKDVLAPLNDIEIMPTGGVSLENISEYRKVGVRAFGMGSLLFNKDLINRGDWEGLKQHLIKVKESVLLY